MGPTRRHLPGLTGLRGVAVATVVAYHLGHLQGGFIGVDVFLVLSGFLITTLLLDDTPRTPADLVRWWGRRVRRLTPAVAVTVAAVSVAFATTSGVALDGLATLTWWQNWHLVLEGTPYWDAAASPLRHAWSLSIEEQFYLLWPPLVVGGAVAARRWASTSTRVVVGTLAAVGSLASFLWAAALSGATDVDLSRVYFGSDTRVGALLLGCALAAFTRRRDAAAGTRLTVAAIAATGALVALAITMSPSATWTYRGGLAVAAVAAGTVVVAATRPGPLSTALGWAPLEWLGVRSYAIYLWSWPTQLFVETRAPGWPAPAVALVTIGVTLLLSQLSLRLVEEPLRHGSSWAAAPRLRRTAWLGGSAVAALLLVVAANSTELTVAEQLEAEFERQPDPTTDPAGGSACAVDPVSPTSTWGAGDGAHDPATVQPGSDPDAAACDEALRLLVLGDSTGRGAANGLRRVAPTGVQVWDRTELGCGLVPASAECSDWSTNWTAAIDEIDPDQVLVYLGVSGDLVEDPDPPFLSSDASELRRSEFERALDVLTGRGARVVWSLPPVPLASGVFYCGGSVADTPCDPDWVERWHRDLRAVSSERGVPLLDVPSWIDARTATVTTDRPDGLHLSGPALDAQAAWILDQLPAT